MTFTVSAIIPAYNQARFLGQAIDSVLSQTYPAELIVVDDGSTDETAQIATGYGARLELVRQNNQGVSAARNHGARRASGKLLAFLDADDIWLPEKLARQVERFSSQPDLGLVHCGIEEINLDGAPLRARLDGLEGYALGPEMLMFNRGVIIGAGSGVVIPRAVFGKAGGFDEQLSTSADWDLCYRLASSYAVGFVPEVLLKYRLHGGNMHRNVQVMEHDMLLAFQKAFAEPDRSLQRIRRRCYANLYSTLAGSFYSMGDYKSFLRYITRCLATNPSKAAQLLGYPVRRYRRHGTVQAASDRAQVRSALQ